MGFDWLQLAMCFLGGLLVTALAIPFLLSRGAAWLQKSRPSEFHHTQVRAVQRLGGLALVASFLSVEIYMVCADRVAAADRATLATVTLGSLACFVLGFCDDLRPLGARKKLIAQWIVASGAYLAGIHIDYVHTFTNVDLPLGIAGYFVTVAWLVTLTNLINLVDGIDGLAAGISLMLMCLLINLGFGGGFGFTVLLPAGVAGALVGFLRFNYPPAKIYMGDGGAYFLGFLIGALSICSSHKGTIAAALIAPAFALALPILDAGLALLRRGLRGLPVFRPDQKHIHHYLITLGFSAERTVLALYAVSFVCLSLAFGFFWSQGRGLPLFCGLLFLVLLIAGHVTGVSRDWLSIGSKVGTSLTLRKQARYALILSQWLEMEVQRHHSLGDLWQDYIFFAQRLGFSSVHVTQPNGEFTWQACAVDLISNENHHVAIACPNGSTIQFTADSSTLSPQLFHLLTDLAAETWHKTSSLCLAKRRESRSILRASTVLVPSRPLRFSVPATKLT